MSSEVILPTVGRDVFEKVLQNLEYQFEDAQEHIDRVFKEGSGKVKIGLSVSVDYEKNGKLKVKTGVSFVEKRYQSEREAELDPKQLELF